MVNAVQSGTIGQISLSQIQKDKLINNIVKAGKTSGTLEINAKLTIKPTSKGDFNVAVNLTDEIATPVRKANEEFTVRIAHTNDRHSNLDNVGRLNTIVKNIKELSPDTIFLDGGDLLRGTPWYNFFEGEADMKAFEELHYDAFVVGNHDLDGGIEKFLKALKFTNTPALAANLTIEGENADKIKPYVIKDIKGKKVAIFGLTENPDKYGNNTGLKWEDPVETCKKIIPELLQKSDSIVLVSHLGVNKDAEIAGYFPQIDVIIGGHSHDSLFKPNKYTHPDMTRNYVTQAGGKNEYIGLVEFNKKGNEIATSKGSLISINDKIPQDPAMNKILKPYADQMYPIINKVVATTNRTISRRTNGKADSRMGNMLTDAIREKAASYLKKPVDIAVFNKTGIRAGLPKGDITVGMINEVIPFDNTICTGELTGKQIEELLHVTCRYGGEAVSGVTYTIENKKPKEIKINGVPLDYNKNYLVATNSYLFEGGSGFGIFLKSQNRVNTGISARDTLSEYLEKIKNLQLPLKIEERTTLAPSDDWVNNIRYKLGLDVIDEENSNLDKI